MESESMAIIEELEEIAKEEETYDNIKAEFDAIRKKLIRDKTEDLEMNKEEIKTFINEQIVSRYLYQKGRIRAELNSDEEISVAIATLKDQKKYEGILTVQEQ